MTPLNHMRDSAPKHHDWERLTDNKPESIITAIIVFSVSVILGYLMSMAGWI